MATVLLTAGLLIASAIDYEVVNVMTEGWSWGWIYTATIVYDLVR
jgi:hypothetical protein